MPAAPNAKVGESSGFLHVRLNELTKSEKKIFAVRLAKEEARTPNQMLGTRGSVNGVL